MLGFGADDKTRGGTSHRLLASRIPQSLRHVNALSIFIILFRKNDENDRQLLFNKMAGYLSFSVLSGSNYLNDRKSMKFRDVGISIFQNYLLNNENNK